MVSELLIWSINSLVEPLLHFAVPFAALRAYGVDWRRTLFACAIALIPDLDVLFRVHRSLSHSAIILAAIALPVLAVSLARRNRNFTRLTLLATIGVATHLLLDVFSMYTPLLWPLLNQSIWIQPVIDVHFGSVPGFFGSAKLLARPVQFGAFRTFDAPVITPEGLGISLVLMAPSLLQVAWKLARVSTPTKS